VFRFFLSTSVGIPKILRCFLLFPLEQLWVGGVGIGNSRALKNVEEHLLVTFCGGEERGENASASWDPYLEAVRARLQGKSETASKVVGSGSLSEVDAQACFVFPFRLGWYPKDLALFSPLSSGAALGGWRGAF